MIISINESSGMLISEGKYFDPFNKKKEYRGWRKPKNFIKNLKADTSSLVKRPNFDPETGDFEKLHPWLLSMVKNAKDEERIKYLRTDASTGKKQLQTKIKRIKQVQNGTPDRYTSVKAIERSIKKGCTVEKLEAHIKWLDTEYRKALNDRAKEIREEAKAKNESSIFSNIEMV